VLLNGVDPAALGLLDDGTRGRCLARRGTLSGPLDTVDDVPGGRLTAHNSREAGWPSRLVRPRGVHGRLSNFHADRTLSPDPAVFVVLCGAGGSMERYSVEAFYTTEDAPRCNNLGPATVNGS